MWTMSSGEEENDEGVETGQIDETDPVFRSVAEADVSLDEMMSLACRQGKLDIVELLLESGAHVDYRNKAGNTPLLEACSQGHTDVARYLLDHNANIDAPTETTSDSALTWACTLGNEAIVELLLERTSNVEHRTKDGCTALMFAALAGHVKVAAMLLDHGAEINVESDSNKDSPLTFACWKGHCDVVELLLERKANIEHRTKEGFTPLMFAALGGHTDVARKLLERKAKVNVPSGSNNDIPLTSACWKGHHDVVKLLLEFKSNIEHRTKDGCTPLMLAAREGHYSVAKLILDSNAEVNVPSGSENNIPLTLACWKGHTDVVELLLEHKSNIEHRNKAGCTPLMLASREGHVETTRLLLNKGAEINTPSGSNDDTPLTLACWKGHVEVVDLLLKHNSKGDHQTKTGCTPLMEATRFNIGGSHKLINVGQMQTADLPTGREGHVAVAEKLILHGADVELPDNYGQSPLFMACWKGHRDVAELLLENVANRDCRTKTGITPLFQACRENHVDVVELLLDYGASVNAPFPNSRENPLTLAGEKGHVELVSLLLSRMANVECHTKKGCTPFHLACKEGHLQISQQLYEKGADTEACDSRNNTPLVAAMKNGHVEVVEWLLGVVNHLPSEDLCQKCLVAPVDDKEKHDDMMLGRTKCYDLVTKAKKAKEQKVQRNTEIFLKELEHEKEREDIRKKKAAAKRRDKRKRRKAARECDSQCIGQIVEDLPLENRPQEAFVDEYDHEQEDGVGDVVDTTRKNTEEVLTTDSHKESTTVKGDNPVIENALNNRQVTGDCKNKLSSSNSNKRPPQDVSQTKPRRPLSSTSDVLTSENSLSSKDKGHRRSQSAGKEFDSQNHKVQDRNSRQRYDELPKISKKKNNQEDPARSQKVEVKTKTTSEVTQSQEVNCVKTETKYHSKGEKPASKKESNERANNSVGSPKKSTSHGKQQSAGGTGHSGGKASSPKDATSHTGSPAKPSSDTNQGSAKRSKDGTHAVDGTHVLSGNDSSRGSTKTTSSSGHTPSGAKNSSSDGEREHKPVIHSPRSKQQHSQIGKGEDSWKEVTRSTNSKTVMFQLTAPNAICGRVIGRGGSKINSITEESGAQITIGKPEPRNPTDRIITIKGSSKAVQRAKYLVTQALNTPSTMGQATPTSSTATTSNAMSSSDRMETNTSPAPVRGNYAAIPSSSSEWPTIEQANNMAVQAPPTKPVTPNKTEKPRDAAKNSSDFSDSSQEVFEENGASVGNDRATDNVEGAKTFASSTPVSSGSTQTALSAWKPYRQSPQSMGACTSAVTTTASSGVTVSSARDAGSRVTSARQSSSDNPRSCKPQHPLGNQGTQEHQGARQYGQSISTVSEATTVSSQNNWGTKKQSSSPTSVATVSISTSAVTTTTDMDRHVTPENPFGVIGEVASAVTALQTEATPVPEFTALQQDQLLQKRAPSSTTTTEAGSGLLTSPREKNKSKFPFFSPWASQRTGISDIGTDSYSSGGKLEGSLPGMELFTSSLFSSGSLSSYPWSTGEDRNELSEERSRSISWSGQHDYQGEQQFISPVKEKFSSSAQKSAADSSAVTMRASDLRGDSGTFKPLSSGIWGPVTSQPPPPASHVTSLSVVCDDGSPDKQAWNNSDSTSSSRSSSRQELSSIMDSDVQGNSGVWNSSAFVEDMTPTPQQASGGMSTALSDQGVPTGAQWVPGRGAYSAPSSPSLPRTQNLPESAPPSVGGRPSVDDFAVRSWTSKQRSPRSLSSSEASTGWSENLPTQPRRSSVDLSQPGVGESTIPAHPWQQYSRMPQGPYPPGLTMRENWIDQQSSSTGISEINQLLQRLALEKYIPVFEEHGIDATRLAQMIEEDLENLGIPKGPRLKLMFAVHGARGSSGSTFQTPGNGFVKMEQAPTILPQHKKPNKMDQPPLYNNHNHVLSQHSDSHLSPLGHKSKQSLKQPLHASLLQQSPGNHGNQHLLSLMTAQGGGGRSVNPGQHVGMGGQNHAGHLPPRPHSAAGNMITNQAYVPVGSHGDQGMSYVPQQQGQYMNHLPYTQGPAPPQVFYPGGFYYFYQQQ